MTIFYKDVITNKSITAQETPTYIPNINERIELTSLGYIYEGFVENKIIHVARETTNITIYVRVIDKKEI